MRKALLVALLLLSSGVAHATNTFDNDMRYQMSFLTKTDDVPATTQILFDADSQAPTYIGYAAIDRAEGDDAWLIFKFTYSGDYITARKSAKGTWTGRAALTYA